MHKFWQSKRTIGALFSLLVLSSMVSTQIVYDRTTKNFRETTREAIRLRRVPLLPNVATLRLASFGNEQVLADILWLQTIQYFGEGSPLGDTLYPALGPMTDTVTKLDPQFAYPYQFGMVVLPFMGQAETAEALGLRAQENIPDNGLLSFYLASIYHLNLKDYKKAAHYYELASTQKNAPGASKRLAGIALNQVRESISDRLVAINFWETVYENAQTEEEKENAKNWWEHMQIVYSLELAAEQYKNKHGHYPASLQELVDTGFIGSLPKSPVGRELSFEQGTGQVRYDRLATQ